LSRKNERESRKYAANLEKEGIISNENTLQVDSDETAPTLPVTIALPLFNDDEIFKRIPTIAPFNEDFETTTINARQFKSLERSSKEREAQRKSFFQGELSNIKRIRNKLRKTALNGNKKLKIINETTPEDAITLKSVVPLVLNERLDKEESKKNDVDFTTPQYFDNNKFLHYKDKEISTYEPITPLSVTLDNNEESTTIDIERETKASVRDIIQYNKSSDKVETWNTLSLLQSSPEIKPEINEKITILKPVTESHENLSAAFNRANKNQENILTTINNEKNSQKSPKINLEDKSVKGHNDTENITLPTKDLPTTTNDEMHFSDNEIGMNNSSSKVPTKEESSNQTKNSLSSKSLTDIIKNSVAHLWNDRPSPVYRHEGEKPANSG